MLAGFTRLIAVPFRFGSGLFLRHQIDHAASQAQWHGQLPREPDLRYVKQVRGFHLDETYAAASDQCQVRPTRAVGIRFVEKNGIDPGQRMRAYHVEQSLDEVRPDAGIRDGKPGVAAKLPDGGPHGRGTGLADRADNFRPVIDEQRAMRGIGWHVEGADGERLIYTLPKPALDGSGQLTLTPLELLDRLARFISAPRRHLHRYHGAFVAHSAFDDSDSATTTPNPATEVMPDDENQRQNLSWWGWAEVQSQSPDAT